MRTDVEIPTHGTVLGAWRYAAAGDALATAAGRPCVVMAHGFAGTRDTGLAPFAERFAAAGCEVLVFDYRGFGTSGGAPRQDVDHRRHREDYRTAVAFARGLEGVDPDRVVLWGSSYSGGHVVPVAAQDGRLAAVISQGAAMDGLAATALIPRYAGLGQLLRLVGHALRDLATIPTGRGPHLVPVVGPPGSLAAISPPGAAEGYAAITGPTFRNEMCARGILRIPLNRPVTAAAALRVPLLVVVAERDDVAPVGAVRAVARRAGGPVETLELAAGHFDIYTGELFERSVAAQVAFLERVLAPAG